MSHPHAKKNTLPRPSYRLRKYDMAIAQLDQEIRRGLEKADEVLGDISSSPTSHGGTVRQVSEPKIVDTENREFRVEVTFDATWVENTDVDSFVTFLWDYCQLLISQVKKHLFETVSLTSEAVGNATEVQAGTNVWDAHIEMLKRTEMRFDEHGDNHLKFYAHPNTARKMGRPTPEQQKQIDETIKKKREEYYAQKCTRRLS
jgi:hypothetical protein